eukprot:CAMPEP_0170523818 /NCGR_PEP_ID=MMETSP0209-20121228/9254_1 /TAXON_ID=665100 ORGANISM="Litonotus pictus, Strain P1" /NCGR_SAMPLE_ID=MMETSP0209 /ASSEMBLY_ACC=CAM_ASM_000301 /LENGTH=443 /DNA_ID=CAMNT_0010812133 /DNA_START=440 /DNA_END=1768 /DNA_ORIENTATION=+
MIWLMPKYEPEMTPYVLLIMFVIEAVLCIYCFFNINYSPENLILKGKYNEAYQIINEIVQPRKLTLQKFMEFKYDLISRRKKSSKISSSRFDNTFFKDTILDDERDYNDIFNKSKDREESLLFNEGNKEELAKNKENTDENSNIINNGVILGKVCQEKGNEYIEETKISNKKNEGSTTETKNFHKESSPEVSQIAIPQYESLKEGRIKPSKNQTNNIPEENNDALSELLVDNSHILSDTNYDAYKSVLIEVDDHMFSHLDCLFTEEYKLTTYYVSIICITSACIFYGPLLIESITLLELVEAGVYQYTAKEIMLSILKVAFSLMLSNPIGGFIAEIKFLGRKFAILLCYFICFVANGVLIWDRSYFEICQTVVLFSGNVAYNNFITYFTEFYPSEIKDTSISFFMFLCRMGGFLSQFLFLILFSGGYMLPYVVLFILLLITNW